MSAIDFFHRRQRHQNLEGPRSRSRWWQKAINFNPQGGLFTSSLSSILPPAVSAIEDGDRDRERGRGERVREECTNKKIIRDEGVKKERGVEKESNKMIMGEKVRQIYGEDENERGEKQHELEEVKEKRVRNASASRSGEMNKTRRRRRRSGSGSRGSRRRVKDKMESLEGAADRDQVKNVVSDNILSYTEKLNSPKRILLSAEDAPRNVNNNTCKTEKDPEKGNTTRINDDACIENDLTTVRGEDSNRLTLKVGSGKNEMGQWGQSHLGSIPIENNSNQIVPTSCDVCTTPVLHGQGDGILAATHHVHQEIESSSRSAVCDLDVVTGRNYISSPVSTCHPDSTVSNDVRTGFAPSLLGFGESFIQPLRGLFRRGRDEDICKQKNIEEMRRERGNIEESKWEKSNTDIVKEKDGEIADEEDMNSITDRNISDEGRSRGPLGKEVILTGSFAFSKSFSSSQAFHLYSLSEVNDENNIQEVDDAGEDYTLKVDNDMKMKRRFKRHQEGEGKRKRNEKEIEGSLESKERGNSNDNGGDDRNGDGKEKESARRDSVPGQRGHVGRFEGHDMEKASDKDKEGEEGKEVEIEEEAEVRTGTGNGKEVEDEENERQKDGEQSTSRDTSSGRSRGYQEEEESAEEVEGSAGDSDGIYSEGFYLSRDESRYGDDREEKDGSGCHSNSQYSSDDNCNDHGDFDNVECKDERNRLYRKNNTTTNALKDGIPHDDPCVRSEELSRRIDFSRMKREERGENKTKQSLGRNCKKGEEHDDRSGTQKSKDLMARGDIITSDNELQNNELLMNKGKERQKEGGYKASTKREKEKKNMMKEEKSKSKESESSSERDPLIVFKERWSQKEMRIRSLSPVGHLR